MLGDVTAPNCSYQATVFYELNASSVVLLQSCFCNRSFPTYTVPNLGLQKQVHAYEDQSEKPIPDEIFATTVVAAIDNATVAALGTE